MVYHGLPRRLTRPSPVTESHHESHPRENRRFAGVLVSCGSRMRGTGRRPHMFLTTRTAASQRRRPHSGPSNARRLPCNLQQSDALPTREEGRATGDPRPCVNASLYARTMSRSDAQVVSDLAAGLRQIRLGKSAICGQIAPLWLPECRFRSMFPATTRRASRRRPGRCRGPRSAPWRSVGACAGSP